MAKTLVIYDTTGRIFNPITGSYVVPVGIPYLEVEVPDGKMVVSVDVSVTPNVPVYTDLPKSEQLTRIELLEQAVNDLLGI